MTLEGMIKDILVLKQNNFNAIRCSHYPNVITWYELCSRFGIYLMDEANVETHGFDPGLHNNAVNPANSPIWFHAILDRGIRMFERDKNFPCIFQWSLGNESGYGPPHLAMASYFRHRDPTRPVHYEGGGSRTDATDIICPMYARVEQIIYLTKHNPTKPVVLCEYCHSMNNSSGNLHLYWEAFRQYPRLQGGFIWEWVDQNIVKHKQDSLADKIQQQF